MTPHRAPDPERDLHPVDVAWERRRTAVPIPDDFPRRVLAAIEDLPPQSSPAPGRTSTTEPAVSDHTPAPRIRDALRDTLRERAIARAAVALIAAAVCLARLAHVARLLTP